MELMKEANELLFNFLPMSVALLVLSQSLTGRLSFSYALSSANLAC